MREKVLRFVKLFGAGLLVGAADIVPGISGGTVAFIIGIYEELLQALASFNAKAFSLLFSFQLKAFFKAVRWQFLLAVILGVSSSFVILASCFTYLLNHELYRTYLYATFMGLVIGSTIFCVKQLSKYTYTVLVSFILGAGVAFFLSGSTLSSSFAIKKSEPLFDVPYEKALLKEEIRLERTQNYDQRRQRLIAVPQSALSGMLAKKYLTKESLVFSHDTEQEIAVGELLYHADTPMLDLWIVACGMIAISAMLLPGISGSYLLTILGMYGYILGALVDLVSGLKLGLFDSAAFRIIGSMLLGIVIGASLFSHVVRYLLRTYRNCTLAALIGFMVGALRAVWPFWSYSYMLEPLRLSDGPHLVAIEPNAPQIFSMEFGIACLFVTLGFLSVMLVEAYATTRVSVNRKPCGGTAHEPVL